ncbi:hypothetical protein [Kitasatospora sp. NPDC057015]|uniref:hypothetical protein n=1 Tax=Kitasatospora sp. NPDC057015 TaxID=3346001 RepID=UPI0036268EC8
MSESVPEGARRLCAAVDIVSWSSRPRAPQRDEAARLLHSLLATASDRAGVDFGRWLLPTAGDGGLVVLPGEIDESRVITQLIGTLAIELRRVNAEASADARVRVRLSFAQGTLRSGPFGFSTDVAIEVSRLNDSAVLRQSLVAYPAADLAVIVADDVFCDVVAHEHHGLPAAAFWPVVAEHKEYRSSAWLWASDRSGGPPEPPGLDRIRAGRPPRESRRAPGGPSGADGAQATILSAAWDQVHFAQVALGAGRPEQAAAVFDAVWRMLRAHVDLSEAGDILLYAVTGLWRAHRAAGRPDEARGRLDEVAWSLPGIPWITVVRAIDARLSGDGAAAQRYASQTVREVLETPGGAFLLKVLRTHGLIEESVYAMAVELHERRFPPAG